MMYDLMVRSSFAAAHQLREIGGGCEKLHGHTWRVEVFLQGEELGDLGVLMDFREVKSIVKKQIDTLDHHYLNEVLEGMNPTTENLAKHLFDKLHKSIRSKRARLHRVRVWESDDACASYERPHLVARRSSLARDGTPGQC